jgi:hypothetical protein
MGDLKLDKTGGRIRTKEPTLQPCDVHVASQHLLPRRLSAMVRDRRVDVKRSFLCGVKRLLECGTKEESTEDGQVL